MEKQAVARMPAQDLLDLLHSSARGLATADIAGAAPAVRAERAGDGADHGAARAGPAVPQLTGMESDCRVHVAPPSMVR